MEGLRKRVLIGVSGGPDSMALLDMMKDKYEVYVGESNDFYRRTEEHYNQKNNPKARR